MLVVFCKQEMYFCYRMLKFSGSLILLLCSLVSVAQISEQHPEHHSSSLYEFVPNQGQWHPRVLYKSTIPYGHLFLESDGLTYDLTHPTDYNAIQEHKHKGGTDSIYTLRKHAFRLQFLNMENAPMNRASNIQKHYYNYYLSSNSEKWATDVHPAGKVTYNNVYKGVDFEISGERELKYQWVIHHPTRDMVSEIQLRVDGANGVRLEDGKLVIETIAGEVAEDAPFVYQIIENERVELNTVYTLVGNVVGYEIRSEIDASYPLIIDPKLIFSTYSGSVGDNFGYTATYDSRGNLYAGGIVDGRGDYPVTMGAYDTTWNGGYVHPVNGSGRPPAGLTNDISISKYDSAGSKLLWATYLGGSDDEYPHSLVADNNDDILVFGSTYSSDFPFTKNAFDTTHAGKTDIFVTKFSSDGTQLLGSTYIGGPELDGLTLSATDIYRTGDLKYNYSDDYRGDIITDADRNIYVATTTRSDGLPTKNATQTTNNGELDGYVFQLLPDCSDMLWGTYLGGAEQDAFYSIRLDEFDRIIIGGGTASSNLPASDTVHSPDIYGDVDGLVVVFDKKTKALNDLTYFGTTKYDQIYFIDVDLAGNIYATGQTEGNLQKTADTYGESGKGQFIFRIDSSLQKIDLQTTFGNKIGGPNLTPSSFLVDVCEHIYFSGWGSDVDSRFHPGNSLNMPITADAEQQSTDGNDFYIIVFGKDAEDLLYSTYFGGSETDDHVDGGTSRFDKKGVIYQSVCSSCPGLGQSGQMSDFPTSPGAAFETNPSVRCSNASFKIDLQISSAVLAQFIAHPRFGCAPLTVDFTNQSILGDSFIWDMGDGTIITDIENPTHTYQEVGEYKVTLTVIDSNACNISSIYETTIRVYEQSEAFFTTELKGCNSELSIDNQSVNGESFVWDFGDGTTSEEENPEHDYTASGNYTIKLTVNPGTICESEYEEEIAISEQKDPKLKLYNVFTPNKEDDLNDCFKFDVKLPECQEMKWKIFNRWGEQIFSTEDPNSCWNGKVDNVGKLVPAGTYFYLLWFGDSEVGPISGQVEVIY